MPPRPQFRLHDHLGNTVVFFEDKDLNGCITTEADTSGLAVEVLQRLWYYPFGLQMENLSTWETAPGQWYRYNGKERDTLSGWYEYGFRWYDAGIGRFTGVDPIADQFPHVSVFNYAENEPVGHIDLWGLQKHKLDNGEVLYGPMTKKYIDSRNEEIAYNYVRQHTVTEEVENANARQKGEAMMQIFSPDNVGTILGMAGSPGGKRVGRVGARASAKAGKEAASTAAKNGDWDVLPTNLKHDKGAHTLAEEIGGIPQARFRNNAREFDAISDKFIGQHKPALGDNFGKSFKDQARATFEAAKSTGREVYYRFDGKPGQKVIDKLNQYSNEYGVPVTIKY